MDSAGNLYIADSFAIRRVSPTGIITTLAGNGTAPFPGGSSGDGGPATGAQLYNPSGVAVDSAGNLYIADTDNNSIRRVAISGPQAGIITTVAGNGPYSGGYSGDGGPATSAQLNGPSGVAVDSAGNLYIADTGNSAIRLLRPLASTALSIITTSPLPPGIVGTAYSQAISASGGTPPYTWSVTNGPFPSGLSLSATGTISGTPSAAGASIFTIQVTDNTSATATQVFSLTIAPQATSGLTITTASLLQASAGLAYAQTLVATGGALPYTWSLASGSLPAGLSLSEYGAITGTPTTAGASTFTVKVTDSAVNSATQSLTVTVVSLSISTSSLPHFDAGAGFVMGFYVLNGNSQAAGFAISFYDDAGKPAALPFIGLGASAILADTIPASGARYYEAGTPQGALLSGSGVIGANPGITIQALVRRLGSDGSYYEAAIPSSPGYNEFQIPFDATTFAPTGAQIYTGFAVANLDGTNPASVSCIARDSSGNLIPNAAPVPALNPLGHWAGYQFAALTGLRGTLDCTSSAKAGAVALRAIGTNAISSLPVMPVR